MEFEKIQKIIEDVLNIEPEKITMESAFVDDLNADSLDVLQCERAVLYDSPIFLATKAEWRLM